MVDHSSWYGGSNRCSTGCVRRRHRRCTTTTSPRRQAHTLPNTRQKAATHMLKEAASPWTPAGFPRPSASHPLTCETRWDDGALERGVENRKNLAELQPSTWLLQLVRQDVWCVGTAGTVAHCSLGSGMRAVLCCVVCAAKEDRSPVLASGPVSHIHSFPCLLIKAIPLD